MEEWEIYRENPVAISSEDVPAVHIDILAITGDKAFVEAVFRVAIFGDEEAGKTGAAFAEWHRTEIGGVVDWRRIKERFRSILESVFVDCDGGHEERLIFWPRQHSLKNAHGAWIQPDVIVHNQRLGSSTIPDEVQRPVPRGTQTRQRGNVMPEVEFLMCFRHPLQGVPESVVDALIHHEYPHWHRLSQQV